eukprot:1193548-Prorocentrum_minimum.AAC.1
MEASINEERKQMTEAKNYLEGQMGSLNNRMQLHSALLSEERSVYDTEKSELNQILADERRDNAALKAQLNKERGAHEQEKQ